jgi:hypothetical protein
MTFTSRDLHDQITTATDASDGDYAIDAIVNEIVEKHGAVDIDTLDTDEFWLIVADHALWTIEEVATHIGATSTGSARRTLSRWGVKAVDYQPGDGGRVCARYSVGEVVTAKAQRPGRGVRTDIEGDAQGTAK